VEDVTLPWAHPTIDEILVQRKMLIGGAGRVRDGVC
jgi:hypothetical protein